jgi:hypothetical protein
MLATSFNTAIGAAEIVPLSSASRASLVFNRDFCLFYYFIKRPCLCCQVDPAGSAIDSAICYFLVHWLTTGWPLVLLINFKD